MSAVRSRQHPPTISIIYSQSSVKMDHGPGDRIPVRDGKLMIDGSGDPATSG
jgi:hypothetical protein